MEVDKIDLSLDDIIKLNRKQSGRGGARGRGRGQQGRGRGSGRGRGGGSTRGTRIITNSSSIRGQRRGRGGFTTGTRRGSGAITAARGRSSYNQVKKNGSSPLNQQYGGTTQPRGRGRGRSPRGRVAGKSPRGQLGGRSPRGQLGRSQRGQLTSRSQRGQQLVQGFTSLNRRRQQAIDSLQKAKQTLAQLNAKQQEQKQSRGLVVNQRRGLQTSTSSLNKLSRSKTRGRGGRGRGSVGRGSLSRSNNNLSPVSARSQPPRRGRGRGRGQGQQGQSRTFGGSLLSDSGVETRGNQQRRRWRQSNSQDSSLLTISVKNSPPPSPKRRNKLPRYNVANTGDSDPELQAQIRSLKPAVSTKYNFKKAVFAQASTSTSLSDRFGAHSPSSRGDNQQTDLLGRKVFF